MRTSIKPHACCRYKQGPIDCILQLVKEHGLKPDDIENIDASILEAGFALVAEPRDLKLNPQSVVDAQFSLPFGAAIAILTGNAFLDKYSMEHVTNPAVKDLMRRIHCVRDPEIETEFPKKWVARVSLTARDGRVFETRIDYPKGDPENPLSWDEIIEKFTNLSGPVCGAGTRQDIIHMVRGLETIDDMKTLMQKLKCSA
jgi:2-methylcitrate dehydratase PrpD